MSKSNLPPSSSKDDKKKSILGKRPRKDQESTGTKDEQASATTNAESGTELFTKRLQKSKLKELSFKLRDAAQSGQDTYKIKQEMDRMKKAVYTDERRLEQRKQGFERAKLNIKKTALSEFM